MATPASIYVISELQHAALNPDSDFLKLLQKSKQAANHPGPYDNIPLYAAVTNNDLKGLQWYLANFNGVLERQNSLGYTPLFWAIDAGIRKNSTVINAMLAKTKDLSHTDKLGNNIMHLLVESLTYQHPETVMALMQQVHENDPSLIQHKNFARMTPLEHAKKLNISIDQFTHLLTSKPSVR